MDIPFFSFMLEKKGIFHVKRNWVDFIGRHAVSMSRTAAHLQREYGEYENRHGGF
jgi:hypothetical protein